jgi:hypothetical protein
MQIKMFAMSVVEGLNGSDDIEAAVNHWLAEHPVITVYERQLSTVGGIDHEGRGYVSVTILIWYRP